MSNHSTNPTVLTTVTLTDQNTGRPVTYNVDWAKECSPSERYPWTHQLVMTRPAGRKAYVMDCVFVGDVLVKHTNPRG
jgi:hypothetical protein